MGLFCEPCDALITLLYVTVIVVSTIVLFAMLRTGLELRRTEAAVLLGVYALFLVWIALETFGVTDWT